MSLPERPLPGWMREVPDGMREVADCPACGRADSGLSFTHPGSALVVAHRDPRLVETVRCYGGPVPVEAVRLIVDARPVSSRRVLSHRRKAARLTL